jgi:protoporphyrinogen oxidase
MINLQKMDVVVIGAGPAGLTAGSELSKNSNLNVILLESDKKIGGLSKTTEYKGCKFDIGPHHFITNSQKVEKWWFDLMAGEEKRGNRFIRLKRFTRIYYKNHFFHYPLQPINALLGLSIFESIRCVLSYIKIRLFPIKDVKTFEDEVTNKFGYRLFSIFFKTYTEKVWGIDCKKISADWAKERIKGFSLSKAIFYAFLGRWFKKNAPRTLSDIFYYPELGAGTLWDKVAKKIESKKENKINLRQPVVSIKHENQKIKSVLTYYKDQNANVAKKLIEYKAEHFFSSMPLQDLILALDPLPEDAVVQAAKKLAYRGLITVNFIVNKKDVCADHWLYVHEKQIAMGRVGNMNNFSVKMSDSGEHTSLSLEYFTFVDSDFWNKTDKELLELGRVEIQKIGLVSKDQILDGMILRESKAYPLYDKNYKISLKIVLDYLAEFSNISLMGRNGLHKYNNMDIAMLSAFEVVDKFLLDNEIKKEYDRSLKPFDTSTYVKTSVDTQGERENC